MNAPTPKQPDLEALLALLAPASGTGTLQNMQRLSAGASAETWAFDFVSNPAENSTDAVLTPPAETRTASPERNSANVSAKFSGEIPEKFSTEPVPLILRRSSGHERFSLTNSKSTEARVQQAASQQGVPVAQVIAQFDDTILGEGYVMQRILGESLAPRILRRPEFEQARKKMTAQCGTILAKLHQTPYSPVQGLRLQDAATQLRELTQFYQQTDYRSPVFELVLHWLHKNTPPLSQPTLVHGDFRLGNFMVDAQGINAVFDWELSHIGDPMEDLGWLCVNAWRFGNVTQPVGGFGQRDELFAAYEAGSGKSVNAQHVRYWELLGCFKWGVICLFQAWSHLAGHVVSLEKAVIGRRVHEAEMDMLACLEQLMHKEA